MANPREIADALLAKNDEDFRAAYNEADERYLDPANETTNMAEAERLFDQWEAVYDAIFDIAMERGVKISEVLFDNLPEAPTPKRSDEDDFDIAA